MALQINSDLFIPESEILLTAIRAQGAGGQNVNKVATAIHLRFDIRNSCLPDNYKEKLLSTKDSHITDSGIIIIKAQKFRSQEKNKTDAFNRLATLIRKAGVTQKKRAPSRPSKAARKRRTDKKTRRGAVKKMRKKVSDS